MDPCPNIELPSTVQSSLGPRVLPFEVFHDPKNFDDAKADCESRNQRLAIIKSSEAYQFLVDIGNSHV